MHNLNIVPALAHMHGYIVRHHSLLIQQRQPNLLLQQLLLFKDATCPSPLHSHQLALMHQKKNGVRL